MPYSLLRGGWPRPLMLSVGLNRMSLPHFTYQLVGFVSFLTGAIICASASQAYRETRKPSVLLIALAAGLGAVVSVLPAAAGRGWGLWYFDMAARIVDGAIWVVGCWLLLRDYVRLVVAQRGAKPNGGPPEPFGRADASGGPPSVS